MRAIDPNVLVRIVTRDDLRQAAAADAFIENGAWVSHLALAESVWVLDTVYRLDSSQLATAVAMLLDHKELTFQDPEVAMAALALYRAKPRLGFSDCLMLEVARKAGHLPLGTFDRPFGRVGGAQEI
jgi:predicted nucleic-acid-binding protein